jgi:calcineurin-like phosphoesterase family protein
VFTLSEVKEAFEMKTWFTADTHFGHANIIEYCGRPYKTVEEMDKKLIQNWNSRIKPDDLVIFLGDFCFKNSKGGKDGEGRQHNADFYKRQLNGNITFIKGNHDSNNSLNTHTTSTNMELGGLILQCVHDPMDVDLSFPLGLCGHVHEKWKLSHLARTKIVNVGVDVWNYMPTNIEEIKKALEKKAWIGKQ